MTSPGRRAVTRGGHGAGRDRRLVRPPPLRGDTPLSASGDWGGGSSWSPAVLLLGFRAAALRPKGGRGPGSEEGEGTLGPPDPSPPGVRSAPSRLPCSVCPAQRHGGQCDANGLCVPVQPQTPGWAESSLSRCPGLEGLLAEWRFPGGPVPPGQSEPRTKSSGSGHPPPEARGTWVGADAGGRGQGRGGAELHRAGSVLLAPARGWPGSPWKMSPAAVGLAVPT